MIRRIRPDQVRLGMYVTRMGGSFFGHPFWRKQFALTSQTQVNALRSSAIPYVEIDESRGVTFEDHEKALAALREGWAGPGHAMPQLEPVPNGAAAKPKPAPLQPLSPEQRRQRAERARAVRSVSRGKAFMRQMFDTTRLGEAVPVGEALELVEEIDTLFQHGEYALLEVVRMKSADEYTYLHSVAVCALMLRFARELDMPDAETRESGLAGLLHDIGKMRIPPAVLHKRGALTDAEYQQVRTHAQEGFEMLKDVPVVPEAAIQVVRLHHERIDGTGYPMGLAGDDIPLVARMGAICDVYDALTSERAYKSAWSPAAALELMRDAPGHFDAHLLGVFAQGLGMETEPQNSLGTATAC
ncbi:MAG: HD-GYP domain-containing protein [Pseudomonadota bacterium]